MKRFKVMPFVLLPWLVFMSDHADAQLATAHSTDERAAEYHYLTGATPLNFEVHNTENSPVPITADYISPSGLVLRSDFIRLLMPGQIVEFAAAVPDETSGVVIRGASSVVLTDGGPSERGDRPGHRAEEFQPSGFHPDSRLVLSSLL